MLLILYIEKYFPAFINAKFDTTFPPFRDEYITKLKTMRLNYTYRRWTMDMVILDRVSPKEGASESPKKSFCDFEEMTSPKRWKRHKAY